MIVIKSNCSVSLKCKGDTFLGPGSSNLTINASILGGYLLINQS